ncbi:hypothetical protein [Gordonia terrae]|uniref:Uncharacterized protein n=2 Tax=Gordonia terrae TaxID=2055 RepID=A0AAD0KEY4_9ACTN|nr:hypothetical protein [Gordonia terrae]ANY25808.1 hypothetical protein BCM27_04125 [Gordonia terrae]AWO86539.1 hypothetical protein DLJ61_04150 [Gordonia terrae]
MSGRRWMVRIGVALGAAMMSTTALLVPTAQAAPAGRVDASVPLSSAVYGTGCTYPLTVAVNSSGWVEFFEVKAGLPPRFVGRDLPQGALASTTWVPQRIGDKYLYAVQNGKVSQPTFVRVRQGYGSNGSCVAF